MAEALPRQGCLVSVKPRNFGAECITSIILPDKPDKEEHRKKNSTGGGFLNEYVIYGTE
jgi:hypothetical protein